MVVSSVSRLGLVVCVAFLWNVPRISQAQTTCPGLITENHSFQNGNLAPWVRFRIAGGQGIMPNTQYVTGALGLTPPTDGHAAGRAIGTNQTGWYTGIYQIIDVVPGTTYRLRCEGQILTAGQDGTNPTQGDDVLRLFWVNGADTGFTTAWPGPAKEVNFITSTRDTWQVLNGNITPQSSKIVVGAVAWFYDPSFTYAINSYMVDEFCLRVLTPAPPTPTPTATPNNCAGQTLIHHIPNINNGHLDGPDGWGDLVVVLGTHTPQYYADDRNNDGNLEWNLGYNDGSGTYEYDNYHQQTFNVTGTMNIRLKGWIKAWGGWWAAENFGWNTSAKMQLFVDGAMVGEASTANTPGRWDTWLHETIELNNVTVNNNITVRLRGTSTRVDVAGVMRAPIYAVSRFDDVSLEICIIGGGATPTPTNTVPANDIDGDLVPDNLEHANIAGSPGSNAWLDDSDGDGLLDGQEDANRNGVVDSGETSPRMRDSDGDGIEDGVEVKSSQPSNPLNSASPASFTDADGDGLGTADDPNDATRDTDGDRFNDRYEFVKLNLAAVTNANVKPKLGDLNGDGAVSNVDALITQSLFLGNITPASPVLHPGGIVVGTHIYGDPNRDGFISNVDALIIQSFFLGNLNLLPL